MHGFTNYQQSKAMYDKGYRHPKPIIVVNSDGHILNWIYIYTPKEYPSFSLADLVTMQGILYNKTKAPVAKIIQSYVDSALAESEILVEQSNQRLYEAYK
jgi:hypothetical protein